MNRDPRIALSQELAAKLTLLDQPRADMPFLMLAKCAEAQAIRNGWPEDLSNASIGEEIEQASLTLHPAQAAAEGATRERLERIGCHGALIIDWLDAAPLDAVPLGQLADRIVAFLRARRKDRQASWRERNRHALREFWARSPADALGVKQELEKVLAQDGKPTK
jgi:hypothetical protein